MLSLSISCIKRELNSEMFAENLFPRTARRFIYLLLRKFSTGLGDDYWF